MATIATTTNATPFQFPGMTLLARHPTTGTYICLVKGSTADNYLFYRSQDSGGTWTLLQTLVRTNLVDVGQIFLDRYNWMFWTYRTNESSQDRIYVRRMDITSGTWVPSGETLFAAVANGGVAGAYYTGLDIKTTYLVSNNFHYIAVAAGTQVGGNQGLTMLAGLINPNGTCQSANQYISGTRQWLHAGAAGRIGPSMDLEHSGNGYSGTPNLWVVFGRVDMRMVKIPWTGSGWSGPTSDTLMYAAVGNLGQMCGRWDASRFYLAFPDPVNTSQVQLQERNRANSSTTVYLSPAHPTGVVRSCTMAYDPSTGNVRIWAMGTSTAVLYQIDWTRATNTWSGWGSTGATILGANADNYGAKRSSNGDARWGLYTAASGAPNTLSYTPVALSYAPNTPSWVSPAGGAAADVALALTLTWAFSDLDPGDTQGSYAVSKQVGAGALSYWRASDSTWQAGEVQNASSTTAITVPSSWAAASDAMHTFKVKVWDAGSNVSGYSAGLMVLPSTPVNPAVTSPTAAQVLGTDHVTVVWTATEQTQFKIQLTLTSGGAVVYDSGWVGDSASRSYLIPYTMATGGDYTIKLQTANNEGLPSAVQSRQFTTNYTPPMVPTVVLAPIPAAGVIRATITNPTPTGGAPAVATQDLYRRPVGDSSNGVRVGTGLANAAVFDDWRAVGSVPYEYRVFTIGVTGVSIFGAWTS